MLLLLLLPATTARPTYGTGEAKDGGVRPARIDDLQQRRERIESGASLVAQTTSVVGGQERDGREGRRVAVRERATRSTTANAHHTYPHDAVRRRAARQSPEEGQLLDRLVFVLLDKVRRGGRHGPSFPSISDVLRSSRQTSLWADNSPSSSPRLPRRCSSSRRPTRSRLRRTGTRPVGRSTGRFAFPSALPRAARADGSSISQEAG